MDTKIDAHLAEVQIISTQNKLAKQDLMDKKELSSDYENGECFFKDQLQSILFPMLDR